MKYAIVLLAKNEQDTIRLTLESIVSQTITPVICYVVDDNSDDKTPQIIKEFSNRHLYIKYYQNESKSNYKIGGHIVDLFFIGKKLIDNSDVDYDYIIKMDADISFEETFFEGINDKLKHQEYGIISGTPFYYEKNRKIFEYSPLWHTHGQFKIYNKDFLASNNTIPENLGWDCADNIIAMENEWKTLADRSLFYQMHRKVGGKSSLRRGRIKHGAGAYLLGYSYLYFSLKAFHDLFKPPFVMGSLFLVYGFLKAHLQKDKRILNRNQKKILRKLYWESMFKRLKTKDFILFQLLKSNHRGP